MDRLAADPRIAHLDGPRADLLAIRAHPDGLLDHLEHDERAVYAFIASGWSLGIAVITDRRVLTFTLLTRGTPSQVAFPYRFTLGPTKALGQAVTLTDTRGSTLSLVLTPAPLERIRDAAGYMPARPAPHRAQQPDQQPDPQPDQQPDPQLDPQLDPLFGQLFGDLFGQQSGVEGDVASGRAAGSQTPPPTSYPHPGAYPGAPGRRGSVPGMPGGWSWGRRVHVWRDAELLAADHMRHLGFTHVATTDGSADGGLDVVSADGAAQAKLHANPTGSPDIQRLNSAASGFSWRLFYATAYSPRAVVEADRLGVALFAYDTDGSLAPANKRGHEVADRAPTPPPERHPFGALTFDGRRQRAIGWAHHIKTAAETPISDRKRKGARQLADRAQALRLLQRALALIECTESPLFKQRRRVRAMVDAEKLLKSAAKLVGTTLH